jgi:hypothetical protein
MEAQFVLIPASLESFHNVRWYRNRSPAHLCHQAKPLIARNSSLGNAFVT